MNASAPGSDAGGPARSSRAGAASGIRPSPRWRRRWGGEHGRPVPVSVDVRSGGHAVGDDSAGHLSEVLVSETFRDMLWFIGVVLLGTGLIVLTWACYVIGKFWRGR